MSRTRRGKANKGGAPLVLGVLGAILLALALPPAAVPLPVHAQDQSREESGGERVTVAEIRITGNEHVSEERISQELPFSQGDEITVPDDLERARSRLADMGLFREVSVDRQAREGLDGIAVSVEVLENPVIRKVQIEGNRDWNADRRLTIPLINLSFRWPFTDYLVPPDRLRNVLAQHGIEQGKVLNSVELRKALGIDQNGNCLPKPPKQSICGAYQGNGYFLVSIGNVRAEETLVIGIVEGVIESIELRGVDSEQLKEQAFRRLSGIPTDRPVKRQALVGAIQALSQSIYFGEIGQQDIRFETGSEADRVVLVINLNERRLLEEPQRIDRVVFTGVTAFPEADLEGRIALPEGPVTNYELLSALEGVHRMYRNDGYTFATFARRSLQDGVLTLDVQEGHITEVEIHQNGYATAKLTGSGLERLSLEEEAQAESDEGPEGAESKGVLAHALNRFTSFLGDLLGTAATGDLPRTRPEIIAQELTLGPGDVLNQYRLTESYRRLQKLGYFESVNFDFAPQESGKLRLIVQVKEKEKLGSLNGGFSISKDGLVGQLSMSGKNLYGLGQDVSVSFNRTLLGRSIVNWNLDYQGRMLIEGTDYLSLNLFNKASQESSPRAHLLQRTGGKTSLALPMGRAQAVFGLRQEWVTKDFEGEEGEEPAVEHEIVNAASLNVNEDSRNNPTFATRGGRRSLTLERAGILGVGSSFTKLHSSLIQHFPTYEDQNVALRLVGGIGVDLPSQEEFILGSAETIRGIETMRAPTVAYANLEYRIQLIPRTVSVAFFADVGSARPFDEIQRSVGVEGRVTVPYVGPVRLALAWPISDRIETVRPVFGFGTSF